MTERRNTERRNDPRRSRDRIARERVYRLNRLDDPAEIALWELAMERASLASRERIRDIRERMGLE
jgi:hypothetical protein